MKQNWKMIAQARELQRLIFDAGFAGIRYPVEFGGQGLTRAHQLAWREAATGYQLPSAFNNVTHGILAPDTAGLRHRGSESNTPAWRSCPAKNCGCSSCLNQALDQTWLASLLAPSAMATTLL